MMDFLNSNEWVRSTLWVALLILAVWLIHLIVARLVVRNVHRIVKKSRTDWDDVLIANGVFDVLTYLVPAILVQQAVRTFPVLSPSLTDLVYKVATGVIVAVGVVAAGRFLNSVNDLYNRHPASNSRPIKGYLQIIKIVLYILAAVTIVAVLLDRSPWSFFAGIGALTAVLLLIFRDTILSLVASIQIMSNDMVRVGDWIEMPKFGADGDVVDIALHTIKVQNWDKTISTIPTHKLIEDSFRNWRGMTESGGRRIKRSINVDVHTVRFLRDEEIDRFGRMELLRDYIAEKKDELKKFNETRNPAGGVTPFSRRLTNLGTFRAYLISYLKSLPDIDQGMTFLVRQLQPGPDGVGLEIYVFSSDIRWANYEGIQADIFDHVMAVAPEFGLELHQMPSGRDLRFLATGKSGGTRDVGLA